MKKFLLYVLLILFIAGLASLAYGFWNAKNIRNWADAAAEIKARHDISARVENIEEKLNTSGGKKAQEFNTELSDFVAELDAISKDLNEASAETEKISTFRLAESVRADLSDFYQQSGKQIQAVESVAKFMSEVFDVTAIFDRMNPDTNASEIRDMIAEAKKKSEEINAEVLPEEMRNSGNGLKIAMDSYLDQFDQYATGKIESHDQLNASYADFSEKVNEFLLAKKKYFDSFQDIDSIGSEIDSELLVLKGVKFSIQ